MLKGRVQRRPSLPSGLMYLKPWMDIPRSSRLTLNGRYLPGSLVPAWRDLLRSMDAYHGIQKDSFPRLQLRIRVLQKQIKPKAEWIIEGLQRRSFDLVLPTGSLQGFLNVYIRQQAHAKAEYLKVMFGYFARQKKELRDPGELKRELTQHRFTKAPPLPPRPGGNVSTSPAKGWVRAKPSSPLTEMAGRVAVEGRDPYHRTGAEATFRDGALVIKNPDQQQLLGYLKSWVERLEHGYREPFFLYLETTSHCLGYDSDMSHKGLSVTTVHYRDEGGTQAPGGFGLLTFSSKDGKVMEMVGSVTRPFHTWRLGNKVLPGKGIGMFKAYAWTASGEIITGIHRHGLVHHSSVGSGKPVRCAGMIGAIEGKVRFLNNDSGHYQPTGQQLWRLAKYLEEMGALHDEFEMDEAARGRTIRLRDLQGPAPDWLRGRPGITIGGHRSRKK